MGVEAPRDPGPDEFRQGRSEEEFEADIAAAREAEEARRRDLGLREDTEEMAKVESSRVHDHVRDPESPAAEDLQGERYGHSREETSQEFVDREAAAVYGEPTKASEVYKLPPRRARRDEAHSMTDERYGDPSDELPASEDPETDEPHS